jgi:hypothetical protein
MRLYQCKTAHAHLSFIIIRMALDSTQKRTFLVLLLLSLVYFLIFVPPNMAASKNIEMVSVFEPDEAVPLPYVFNMIRPADSLKQALIQFAFYKYYFYGFPYFAYSAALLFPLQWLNLINNTSLVMLILRQLVSLLPLLAAIWILVYLQTRFKGYRAILLFIFLVSLPVVLKNNFWWHPDGLAILFAVLAIFFLERDDLQFGKNFYLSAVMCGVSAGAKGVGFFLFLTIFVYLVMGRVAKKISMRKVLISAFGFLGCMAAAYLLVFPTLAYPGIRERYFQVMISEYSLISQGYEVEYAKGISVALPAILKDYASPVFLLLVIGGCAWGMLKSTRKLFFVILLTWLIPITFSVFFLIHYKFQYWLPVALPLFSTIVIFFPEKFDFRENIRNWKIINWSSLVAVVIISCQFLVNINQDFSLYSVRLFREQNSPAIQFYGRVEQILSPLLDNRGYHLYHDVRMYVPARPDWNIESIFEMLDYDFLKEKSFDLILLRQQRIFDYLDPDAIALDADQMAKSQVFYRDAQQGNITGYHLLYRDTYGLVFVRNRLYQNNFQTLNTS